MNDELRVHRGGKVTIYSGTLEAITPEPNGPNGIRFQASSFRVDDSHPATSSALKVQPWRLLVSGAGTDVSIDCIGNVPVYVGGVFAFDGFAQ